MERFLARVIVQDDGCWRWTGFIMPNGYGTFFAESKRMRGKMLAHRWIYEQKVGAIASRMVLDHLCRNTMCVNPEHLEAVTNRENTMRGLVGQKTHCKRGHAFDEENTMVETDGRRRCRECKRLRVRAKYATRGRVYDAVRRALRDGLLIKKPCEHCESSERVQAHHTDYTRPLDVTWLCAPCHGVAHRKPVAA